jgi:multiple sugar transport system substrate-binding protein
MGKLDKRVGQEEAPAGAEPWRKQISRRKFVGGAGAAGLGLLLAGCGGDDDESTTAAATETSSSTTASTEALKAGLAPGMYGGPVGFDGAERYQYPLDSEEGRAIEALRALKKDGKAPDTLVVQVLNFARPQFEKGYPEGAPSHVALFEEETGIKIKYVETDPASEYQENLRNVSTKNGSFDLVTSTIEEMGDFAEAGLLLPLDEFVAKYKPSWSDPEFGYLGGETTVALFNQYNGTTYTVAFDNDTQPYFYRSDILEDPKESADFEDKYGRPLAFPETWEQQAEVAAFFTRKDASTPLYGDVSTLAPFWCAVNWQQRFVCSGNPNQYYFNEDGSANVDNEAGARAFAELQKSLEWHEPGSLEKDWIAQYGVMGAGNGFAGSSFPNQTKLLPGNPDLDTANVGSTIKSAVMPGRVVDGDLIRRPVIFYNICYGVNAFADKAHHEAAYLYLQWAGGARIFTFLTLNPGGYQDPHHIYSLKDDLVRELYKPQAMDTFAEVVPRTAPPVTLKGGGAYRDSLSEEIQKVLTKQSSPEKAAKSLQSRWDKITDEQGVDIQVAALPAFFKAFPTITDTPSS